MLITIIIGAIVLALLLSVSVKCAYLSIQNKTYKKAIKKTIDDLYKNKNRIVMAKFLKQIIRKKTQYSYK